MIARMAWVPVPADPALVERVLSDAQVDRSLPPPPWAGYGEVLAQAVARWLEPLGGAFNWLLGRLGGGTFITASKVVAILLLASVAAWAVFMTWRLVSRRRGRPGEAAAVVTSRPTPSLRDAQAWREELERRLAAGDVRQALEALWWWVACRLTGRPDIERSCTSRELVARAGRDDVVGPARELDRLLYGPRIPGPDDLRALVTRMDRALP